ncbi:MAG: hypothetical protein WBA84_09995 [Carnobacterium sp.]|uniref:hypothetical protein n=1 Tax=Carnobacterium sp. TaxID=48221 RepID=UPI003C723744
MLNKYEIQNKLKFNNVGGTLIKTHPDSWFERYHLKSSLADRRLGGASKVTTLQTMIVGDMEVLSEAINTKDYLKEETE